MKNFILLTLLSIFSLGIQAQGIVVTYGNVTDANGQPVANANGTIIWSNCGTWESASIGTNVDGDYSHMFQSCPQDSIVEVFFSCPNDPNLTAQGWGSYVMDPAGTPTSVLIDIENACAPTTGLPCDVSVSGVEDTTDTSGASYWTFQANITGGEAPFTFQWDFGGGIPVNTVETQTMTAYFSNPGTYQVSVTVNGADGFQCYALNTFVVQGTSTCQMTSQIYAMTCDDSATPNDPTDDFYSIQISANATNGSSGYTVTSSDGSFLGGFNYSTVETITLPATGTTQTLLLEDVNDANCTSTQTVWNLSPCSATPQDTCAMNITYIPGDFAPWWSFTADAGVLPTNTSYQWVLPNGANLIDSSQTNNPQVDIEFTNAGVYTICAFVYDLTTGATLCEECITITYPDPNGGQCWTGFDAYTTPNGDVGFEAWVQGGIAPYTYDWSVDGVTIQSGSNNQFSITDLDSFYLCLTTTDANGFVCDYCENVGTTNPPTEECLDWSVIDLANAPCTSDWDPVCGCDGITYENACIAYYCFGVTEWTDGECDYSDGGGNTDGNPTDSLCQTTAEFFYFGGFSANGDFEVNLFGNGVNADEFIWTFGDGTSATGAEQTIYYSSTDSIQAYTICLTTISWGDSCTATVCETIVLDNTPNGIITGQVSEGANLLNRNEVVLRSSATPGDPIAGLLVELEDVNGNMIASTTTDANGNYSFNGIAFGDYFVHVNVSGIPHTPYMITLEPRIQGRTDLNFEVNSNAVVSNENLVAFASDVLLSPNPTQDFVNLSMSITETVDANILVTDILGQTIQTRSVQLNRGREAVRVDLDGLPSGMYMISLQANGETLTQKVLKK